MNLDGTNIEPLIKEFTGMGFEILGDYLFYAVDSAIFKKNLNNLDKNKELVFQQEKDSTDGDSPVIYEWTILKEPELYIYSPYGYPKAGLIKYNWDTQATELISETSDNCQMEYIAVGQNAMYYLSSENVPYKMTFSTRKSEILKEKEDVSRIYLFNDKYVLWSPNNMPLLEQ